MADQAVADDRQLILFDVNALVALALSTHQHHRAAHAYLAGLPGQWATCPTTETSLTRLLLNPAVTGSQRKVGDVRAILLGMRRDPRWMFLGDTSTFAAPLVDVSVLMGHQQVTDLHLVNLAAVNQAVLATFDAALPTWLAPPDRRYVTLIPS